MSAPTFKFDYHHTEERNLLLRALRLKRRSRTLPRNISEVRMDKATE
jgi:hypothetical protein